MADERVVLNVGGQRFEASLATLTKYEDSLLGHMFSEENRDSLKPDEKGEYFFDRFVRFGSVYIHTAGSIASFCSGDSCDPAQGCSWPELNIYAFTHL
jgi:hypothetical protein